MDVRPGLTGLLAFLSHLRKENISYSFVHDSVSNLIICFGVPGMRFEVRFAEDEVDWCIFEGDESVERDFTRLFELIKDE